MKQTTQTTQRPRWHGLATRTAATRPGAQHRLRRPRRRPAGLRRLRRRPCGPRRDHRQGQRQQRQPLHPARPPTADQSLNNTDIQLGGSGNDVMIGLLGDDVQLRRVRRRRADRWPRGWRRRRPAQQRRPVRRLRQRRLHLGPRRRERLLPRRQRQPRRPGGGPDRPRPGRQPAVKLNPANGYSQGLPSVDVSGLNAQCTIDKVPADSELGYEFLVRFRNAAGALVVTLRQVEVEQVFCPSTQRPTARRRASSTPTCARTTRSSAASPWTRSSSSTRWWAGSSADARPQAGTPAAPDTAYAVHRSASTDTLFLSSRRTGARSAERAPVRFLLPPGRGGAPARPGGPAGQGRGGRAVRRGPGRRAASTPAGSTAMPPTRTSQCRWGPVERPVEPIRPSVCPRETRCPGATAMLEAWACTLCTPAPWSTHHHVAPDAPGPGEGDDPRPRGRGSASRRRRPGRRPRAARRRRPPRPGRRTSGAPRAR